MLLSFSFGGFLFYAGVVVPIGTQVLDPTTQGFVTQRVTNAINVATLVTASLILLDVHFRRRAYGGSRTWGTVLCSALILLCSVVLFSLHAIMDRQLDAENLVVEDSTRFYGLHRIYLRVSTLQWLASLPIFWMLAGRGFSPRSLPSQVTETELNA